MLEARKQMEKMLQGRDGCKNGESCGFKSKDIVEEMNSKPEPETPSNAEYDMINVMEPDGFFNTSMGNWSTSSILKELREKQDKPDICARCGATSREDDCTLLLCSGCKGRKYSSTECQKQHWAAHKKACEHFSTLH